jgi:drug/metabolite transporter (DMT)-like permease
LRGALFGLAAAALFGASTPLAKLLLDEISPVLLAGLLYGGATIGLWGHRALTQSTKEAPLSGNDYQRLALLVLLGGVLAPVSMLLGLERVSALSGSLLLNLEAPFTVLFAVALFGEHLGRHAAIATGLILGGALLLKLEPGALGADGIGVALVALACGCWAVDNNLTQRLSAKDPFAIVRVKTLVAGVTNTLLGLWLTKGTVPQPAYVFGALLLGSLGYGASVVLDAYALRFIGAAREAAYFATAPFVGAIVSLLVLGDDLRWHDAGAMLAMALGVGFLLRERHSHFHVHDEVEHEHLHVHDEHHQHVHDSLAPTGEPHSHVHRHSQLGHEHAHVPDAHHRHRH